MKKTPLWCSAFAAVVACIAVGATSVSAACPSYVKKDEVSIGSSSDLPEGWFAYLTCTPLETQPGIYKSPIRRFEPSPVPNTQDQTAYFVEVSYDGKWLLFMNFYFEIFLIRPDGTGMTQVPTSNCEKSGGIQFPRTAGFYRNSPNGAEVAYTSAYQKMRAIAVDLQGDEPQFGDEREVVNYGEVTDVRWGKTNLARSIAALNGGHLFSERVDHPPWRQTTMFLTIPDGGSGTAGYDDIWFYSGIGDFESTYGDHYTISPDGGLVAWNLGTQGSQNTECFPCWDSGLDQKGFVVTEFMESDMPRLDKNQYLDQHTASVNWCPEEYRFGAFHEVGFTEWSWSNREDYIVGVQRGSKAPDPGVWIVNWNTNEWTLLTKDVSCPKCPAAYVAGGVSIAALAPPNGRAHQVALNRTALYDIRGRRLASCVSDGFDSGIARGVYIAGMPQHTKRFLLGK